jgi:hypothetical protein
MTISKKDNSLRGERTPAYVDRTTGAAELSISPATWDQWVKEGLLPKPCEGFPEGLPRWRWEDVDRKLSGSLTILLAANDDDEAAMRGAAFFGAKTKNRSRRAS